MTGTGQQPNKQTDRQAHRHSTMQVENIQMEQKDILTNGRKNILTMVS